MAQYQRSNARVFNDVILKRSFYNNGSLQDPFEIDKIEIWKGSYDPEVPELKKDTIYGSRVVLHDIVNNAYDELGLQEGTDTKQIVGVLAYEESFINQTDFTVTHGLTDRYCNVIVYNDFAEPQIIRPDEIISVDENNIRITFAIPQSGTIKVYGTEELCERTQYTIAEHEEHVVAVDPITVNHGLDDDDPRVIMYDENYRFVYPDTITVLDSNRIEVDFGIPFTGVILVYGGTAGFRTTGFGFQPAAISTNAGPFTILTGANDQLHIQVDGTNEAITLAGGVNLSVDDIIGDINSKWSNGSADNYNGYIRLKADGYGRDHSMTILNPPNNGADDLGLALQTYEGIGLDTAYIIGSKQGNFTITANLNDKLKIQTNYNDPITITLNDGVRSASNIMNDINGQLTAAGYPALASTVDNKIKISSTTMDGIEREGVGQYKVIYGVPGTYISEGVLNNIYKDVWFYAPNVTYMQTILADTSCCLPVYVADDTCCFIVYPENYFSSCGMADFKYSFTLQNKQLNKDEIRDMVINVEPIPKYDNTDMNLYVLPITDAEYKVVSYGGNEVIPWTPIDNNRGLDLKTRIDTTNMQDGSYKMRVKLNMPQGEVIISDWMRFNVLGPCTI